MNSILNGKKGAIELSMTTVVVIVLAMTMLILGLTLIRTIFTGAQYNVQSINDKVRGEINSLFLENADQKIVIYLPEQKAVIKQGEAFGVAFALKNIEPATRRMDYSVTQEAGGNCPASANPQSWIIVGGKGTPEVTSGDSYYGLIRIQPPLTAPLCLVRFKLTVANYADTFFDVEINSR
jgi:hypothetical protein